MLLHLRRLPPPILWPFNIPNIKQTKIIQLSLKRRLSMVGPKRHVEKKHQRSWLAPVVAISGQGLTIVDYTSYRLVSE